MFREKLGLRGDGGREPIGELMGTFLDWLFGVNLKPAKDGISGGAQSVVALQGLVVTLALNQVYPAGLLAKSFEKRNPSAFLRCFRSVKLCNITTAEGFRVNAKIRRQLGARKQRIERRLDKSKLGDCSQPVMSAANIQFEVAERTHGMSYGGLGRWCCWSGDWAWPRPSIGDLHLLKFHLPYHESDHVLNLAYNALCDGRCLEDLELRRNDEVHLDALGRRRIPDPTTAGDFCRRFAEHDIRALQDVFDETRKKVWTEQPAEFFDEARLDMDGTFVVTGGECKQGMDINYKNSGATIRWSCRWPTRAKCCRSSIARAIAPAMKGRPTKSIAYWTSASPADSKVLLRGDTDFSQTRHLDRWSADPRVRFIFGMDCTANLHILADDLPLTAWKLLKRPKRHRVKTKRRKRPANVKAPSCASASSRTSAWKARRWPSSITGPRPARRPIAWWWCERT